MFGIVSLAIGVLGRAWVGLIAVLLVLGFSRSQGVNKPLDLLTIAVPPLVLTFGLWVFGRTSGTQVLTRSVRIIVAVVGAVCLLAFIIFWFL